MLGSGMIFLKLGSTIASAALRFWFRDSPIAADAAASTMDILASKTDDVLAQRSANRQFERIGERIAHQMSRLIEEEFRHVDQHSIEAVSLAANEVVLGAGFSTSLLAERNLDPELLTEHFNAYNRSRRDQDCTRLFSSHEVALFSRLLSEASAYIIDISGELPGFTERTLAEILRRETALLDRADAILQEIALLRAHVSGGTIAASRYESEYRRAVIRKLDSIQLYGVDISASSKKYKLTVAYVTLAVARFGNPTPLLSSAQPTEANAEESDDEGPAILTADTLLSSESRLIIRGLAGSGKTTLLQWIAVKAATGESGPGPAWAQCTPYFVRLREYAELPLPKPQFFPGLLAPALESEIPASWPNEQLRLGRAFVLVDGLDELPEARREEVRDWLKDLVDTFPQSRFILTTRPHAAERGWLDKLGFVDAEMQEMSLDDVDAFVDHWHNAVREEVQSTEEKEELDKFRASIKKAIRSNPALRRLASTPLLCAMLCALHRDRAQKLPSDRLELYRACCEMFLRRDLERKISLKDYPDIGDRQKRALLEDLAYWLILNGWSEVSADQADNRFAAKLAGLQGIPFEVSGKAVRRLFVDRSGILREPSRNSIDFPHRSFQEYMAAKAAIEAGDFGVLVNNAANDQWREVIIVAAGLARPAEAKDLVSSLLHKAQSEPSNRTSLLLLAAGCCETMIDSAMSTRHLVMSRLASVFPPRNDTQSLAISSLGDAATPHLTQANCGNAIGRVYSLRTLMRIGTDESLNIIEGYVTDWRKTVRKELLRGATMWPNREEYAQRIIARLRFEHLNLTAFPFIPEVGLIDSLRKLDMWGSLCEDLTPLAGLKRLYYLDLGNCRNIRSISPIVQLPKLCYLRIRGSPIEDAHLLASMPTLAKLWVSDRARFSFMPAHVEVLENEPMWPYG